MREVGDEGEKRAEEMGREIEGIGLLALAACAGAFSRRQQQLWGEGRKTTGGEGGGGGLGRNRSWAGSAAGERQVSGWASLFYFCSIVLFFFY